jgi:hypothetical protein
MSRCHYRRATQILRFLHFCWHQLRIITARVPFAAASLRDKFRDKKSGLAERVLGRFIGQEPLGDTALYDFAGYLLR